MRPTPQHRAPDLNWRAIVVMTFVVAAMFLGATELWFRWCGFRPAVTDSAALFGSKLRHADDPSAIALVGTSRFQVGLDPAQIEQAFPGHRVINLALIGVSAIPMLEHLASNTDFAGVAVFEFMPIRIYTSDGEDVVEAKSYLRRVDSVPAYSPFETTLRTALQSRFVLLNPEIRLEGVVRELLKGELPTPYQDFDENRFAPRDYARHALDEINQRREATWRDRAANDAVEGEALRAREQTLRQATDTIRKRGGRVVFYRIQSSGAVRALENELFPRRAYWDRFAADCPDVCLNFEDQGPAAAIELVEGSHADHREAVLLTASLIDALKGAKVVPAP